MTTVATRHPEGVNTASVGDMLYSTNYPAQDPMKLSTFFDDFHDLVISGRYTVTTTEDGAGSATEALADEENGVLLITNAAGDDDLDSFQTTGEAFKPKSGRNIWFEAKFKLSDATQSDFLIGLVVTDTTPLANTDGIYFRKDDGDTNLDFETNLSSSASTATAISTLADATYVTVGFFVSGTDFVDYYVNGDKLGRIETTIPTGELKVTFHIQNGEAVAKTASIDYVLASQTR